MKKHISILICTIIASVMMIPSIILAADTPKLKSIEFTNSKINGEFSPESYEYELTLDDPSVTPELAKYDIDGEAELFITYDTDDTNSPSGITATLEYASGTTKYTFAYKNAIKTKINSNSNLASVTCQLGEVYPAINEKDTTYKLYIPKDMTEIKLTATTEDIGAKCEAPSVFVLNTNQEHDINITVTATDGSTKLYTFKVKRLDKTMAEVTEQMQSADFTSLVEDELIYKRPEFAITIASVAGGIVLLIIFICIAKRLTIKVGDNDEEEFFAPIDTEDDSE